MTFLLGLLQGYSMTIIVTSIIALLVSNFTPLAYRSLIQVVALLVIVSGVYLKGGNDERLVWEAKEQANKLAMSKVETKREQLSTSIAVLSAKNRALIVEKATLKDVNEYITKQDNAGCVISPGFVRLHNDSAAGELSQTTR